MFVQGRLIFKLDSNWTKIPLIYSVSHLNFWACGVVWEAKPPVVMGLHGTF